MNTRYYLDQIQKERDRQDEKWGEQNHHPLMWFSIIAEEFGELCRAFNEYSFDDNASHFDEMETEAIQTAACCVAMLECIDRLRERGVFMESGRKDGVEEGRCETDH